jgi:hypothetical protein
MFALLDYYKKKKLNILKFNYKFTINLIKSVKKFEYIILLNERFKNLLLTYRYKLLKRKKIT